MSEQDEIATVNDVRRAGFCARGLKNWCEQRGLDLRALIRNGGIPAETLREMKDAQADLVLEKMRERLNRGR